MTCPMPECQTTAGCKCVEIVERLRGRGRPKYLGNNQWSYGLDEDCQQAAALIEHQRLEIARLRGALTEIACYDEPIGNARLQNTGSYVMFAEPVSVKLARAALDGQDQQGPR
jgi:hypothetical protein